MLLIGGEITEKVVEDPLAESPVDLHEVGQAVEILHARDPVWFDWFLRLLAGIVEPEEAALLRQADRDTPE